MKISGVLCSTPDFNVHKRMRKLAAFQAYGGSLQFVFDENGGAQMVQGGGTLDGSWSYTEENTVGVLFEREEGDLFYLCSFTELDGQVVMVAYSDETGENALYFVQ